MLISYPIENMITEIDTLQERQHFEDYSPADLLEVTVINLPRDRKSIYLSFQLYNTSKTQ